MSAPTQRESPMWAWSCRLCNASGEARALRVATSLYYQHYHLTHHEPTSEVESA